MWPVLLSLTVAPGGPLPEGGRCTQGAEVGGEFGTQLAADLAEESGASVSPTLCVDDAVVGGVRGLLQVESCDAVTVRRVSWQALWMESELPGLVAIASEDPGRDAGDALQQMVSVASRGGWSRRGVYLSKGPATWAAVDFKEGPVASVVLSAGEPCPGP